MKAAPKIKTIIVDDEAHARESLRSMIHQHLPQLEIVAEANDVDTAVSLIRQFSPDLLLLDVQLGDQTCFEILGRLAKRSFDIIFTTAYDHYAISAIKLAAIDYLLKPIQLQELKEAIARCEDQSDTRQKDNRLETLFQNESGSPRRIMLSATKGFEMVDIDQILYCIADGNYTDFYLQGGRRIKVAKTMGEYEPLLEPLGIFRIHISHMVNIRFIKTYSGGRGGTVIVADGRELQLSHRRKQDFLKRLDFIQRGNAQ